MEQKERLSNNMLLKKALDIATNAHKEQTDKAGKPYILHPIRVSERCNTVEEKIVALLHDVIEDTEITPTSLLSEGFPAHIVKAILSVTKQENENYDDFVKRCSANSIGKVVKIHDLEDNMDITRLKELTENDLQRLNKYLKAYYYLKGE